MGRGTSEFSGYCLHCSEVCVWGCGLIVPAGPLVSGTAPLTQEELCAQAEFRNLGWEQTMLIIDLNGRDFIHSVFQELEVFPQRMVMDGFELD